MTDPHDSPTGEDAPNEPAAGAVDPMAMLAFLQRLVATMSSGGDVEGLMESAPPGFRELFADAERRVQAGETPDLGALLGMFGAGDDDEEPAAQDDVAGEDPGPSSGQDR